MTPLDAAHQYATAGYRVFPLKPRSKAPATRHGLNDATLDASEFALSHWDVGDDCGIGLALGAHPTHGYVIAVDIDDHGADGEAVWRDLCDGYDWTEPDDCPEQITGGGGRHLLFTAPHEIRNGELGPDVQTRGEGGYIVVEPSIHPDSGQQYGWTEGREPWTVDPTPAPEWMLAHLKPPDRVVRERVDDPNDTRPGTRWMRATSWASILEPDGWTPAGSGREVDAYWTRPGKRRGVSASQGYAGSDVLTVFTSSVPFLESFRTYDKLGYIAARDHGGDIAAAAAWAAGEVGSLDVSGVTVAHGNGGVIGLSGEVTTPGATPEEPNVDLSRLSAATDAEPAPVDADDDGWPIGHHDDIAAILSGDYTPPEPTLMRRQSGGALIYPGKVHSIAGEPGAGKTWIALAAIAEVLADGGEAMLVDYEDRLDTAVRRLASMGVAHCTLLEHFHYVTPTVAYVDGRLPANVIDIAGRCTIVVTDSVGEALSHSGMNQNNDDEVAAWMRNTARRLADGGAAVVVLDHVEKNTETRGRWAIGSQRKLAAIDGIAYMAKAIKAASKDKEGVIRLSVSKDRGGHYQHGTDAAVIRITPNGTANEITVDEPHDHDDDTGEWMPTGLMEKVSRFLETAPSSVSGNVLRSGVSGKATYVDEAVAHLVRLGHVVLSDGDRGATMHSIATPYRDPESEVIHSPDGVDLVPKTTSSRPRPDLVPDEVAAGDDFVPKKPPLPVGEGAFGTRSAPGAVEQQKVPDFVPSQSGQIEAPDSPPSTNWVDEF